MWDRTAKSVPVFAAARRAFRLADSMRALTPPELIRAILCARRFAVERRHRHVNQSVDEAHLDVVPAYFSMASAVRHWLNIRS